MARISIMEALARVLTASKDYTDEKSILLDEDDGTFGGFFEGAYPELNTVNKTPIGAVNEINSNVNSKQNIVDNMLETDDKTVVGAINELKEEVTVVGATYSFDIDNVDSYESFSPGYGITYYKIMELEEMPTDLNEMPESPYTLTMYDSSKGGIIETPAIFEINTDHFGYTQHFISTEDYSHYQIITLLYENWIPNAGVEFSPGVWAKHRVKDDGTIAYPISITMGEKTIKKELENKADLINEHELISMLEEELGLRVEE